MTAPAPGNPRASLTDATDRIIFPIRPRSPTNDRHPRRDGAGSMARGLQVRTSSTLDTAILQFRFRPRHCANRSRSNVQPRSKGTDAEPKTVSLGGDVWTWMLYSNSQAVPAARSILSSTAITSSSTNWLAECNLHRPTCPSPMSRFHMSSDNPSAHHASDAWGGRSMRQTGRCPAHCMPAAGPAWGASRPTARSRSAQPPLPH